MELKETFLLATSLSVVFFYVLSTVCFLIFRFLLRLDSRKSLLFTLIIAPLLFFGIQLIMQLAQLK